MRVGLVVLRGPAYPRQVRVGRVNYSTTYTGFLLLFLAICRIYERRALAFIGASQVSDSTSQTIISTPTEGFNAAGAYHTHRPPTVLK